MKEFMKRALFSLLGATFLSGNAYAWGVEVHDIVALIAYNHLTPVSKAQVDALLQVYTDNLTKTNIASRAI